MDERDFAELISVFLKGTESDKAPGIQDNNEAAPTAEAGTKASTRETELRKNIIEALAEKIKESQGFAAEDLTTDDSDSGLEALDETEIFDDEPSDMSVPQEPEHPVEEQLVTKEEVEKLLNKEEPAEIIPLQRVLHRFLDLDGVIAALLITRDGFTVDYASDTEFEFDMISAVVATGFASLDKIGHELNQGDLEIAMLEYEGGPVIIAPLIHDVALAIVASQWTTLGRIRWEIKKQSQELINYL